MLGLLVMAGSLLAGYGMAPGKARDPCRALAYALFRTRAIYVILDLEFPRLGLIRLDACDQALAEVRESKNL